MNLETITVIGRVRKIILLNTTSTAADLPEKLTKTLIKVLLLIEVLVKVIIKVMIKVILIVIEVLIKVMIKALIKILTRVINDKIKSTDKGNKGRPLPGTVSGDMSPYPTVPMVTTAHHRLLNIDTNALLELSMFSK